MLPTNGNVLSNPSLLLYTHTHEHTRHHRSTGEGSFEGESCSNLARAARAVFNDVNIFDTTSRTWHMPEFDSVPPSKRRGHTMTLIPSMHHHRRDHMLLFAGAGPEMIHGRDDVFDDIWDLDLDNEHWHLLETTGQCPSARSDHSATFLPGHGLVVYGGIAKNVPQSDISILDMATMCWSLAGSVGTGPGPLYSHSAFLNPWYPEVIHIFGGRGIDTPQGDLYRLSLGESPRDCVRAQYARNIHTHTTYTHAQTHTHTHTHTPQTRR